jgi:hypothetical protein
MWQPHEYRKSCLFRKADISVPSQSLSFEKVQHRVDTTDAQPSSENGGIVVMVTGALMVSCNDLAMLCSTGAKSSSKHDSG